MTWNPDRIKSLRNKLNISQEKLAQRIGVSWHTVNRWENGKRQPSPLAIQALEKLEGENGNNNIH